MDFFKITPKKRSVKLKRKKGVLFSNPEGIRRRSFYFANGIFVGSILYLIYLYYPLGKAYYNYASASGSYNQVVEEESAKVFEEQVFEEEKEFRIQIPRILASSSVVADVSPFNPNQYLEVLSQEKVAHSNLSEKPGTGAGSMIYIFAHSTQQGVNMARKNSVFYLLGELQAKDRVFVKYGENVFTYEVYDKKIVKASEIEYLNYSEYDKEVLILQTCWPIGTDWKRLLIFGKLLE